MKNLPLYILFTLVFFRCLTGLAISSENGTTVDIAGFDISHLVKYDGGYDVYGTLNSDLTIDTIERVQRENEIEEFMQKIDFGEKTVRTENELQNLEIIYFIGIEPTEHLDFYVFFFDDFTKAVNSISTGFDINNPDVQFLNNYIYSIENPEFVKQLFINKGLYQ